jgi:hypothetical protein
MENRERDRVSQRDTPTDAGQINRQVEEEKGRQHHSGTTAEFGQNIGESEFPSDAGSSNELGSSGSTKNDRASTGELGSTGSSEGRH